MNGSAREADVDLDRMVWLWDMTTQQDKAIIERNAAGILARAYRPGPYTTLEAWTSDLVARYLRELPRSGSGRMSS